LIWKTYTWSFSSIQHNQTNTRITTWHPDDNDDDDDDDDDDDAELTQAKKRQKYCHLPRMASLIASTYCAGTQYTQYLDASVGPSWIPCKQKKKKNNNPALPKTESYYSHETNDNITVLNDCITLSSICYIYFNTSKNLQEFQSLVHCFTHIQISDTYFHGCHLGTQERINLYPANVENMVSS